MIRSAGSMICGGLLAVLLAGCDGPVERSQGSLEGKDLSRFVIHLEPEKNEARAIGKSDLRSAMDVVEARIMHLGIGEFEISKRDDNSLLVQMSALNEDEVVKVREVLGKVTSLGLHKVSERSEELDADGRTLAQRVLDGEELVVGQKAFRHVHTDMDGNQVERAILVYRRAGITAADIDYATPSPQQPDAVSVALSKKGTEKMVALTRNMRPGLDRIAIIINGEVMSAPVVHQVPLGKHFIIEGLDEPGSVESLATGLMHPGGLRMRVEALD